MANKKILAASFILVLVFSLVNSAIGPMDEEAAKAAMNVNSFASGSAYGGGYSDGINSNSGKLGINELDLKIPGRNGLDVVIMRGYSSDIFSRIPNSVGGNQRTCEYSNNLCDSDINGDENDYTTSCRTPTTVQGINNERDMATCSDSGEQFSASYRRAKVVGRGWEMTLGKVETPTPILFKRYEDPSLLYPTPTDNIPTYEFVSLLGVTKDALTLFNGEQELIYPSMFRKHRDLLGKDIYSWVPDLAAAQQQDLRQNPLWNIALAYRETDGAYSSNLVKSKNEMSSYYSNAFYLTDNESMTPEERAEWASKGLEEYYNYDEGNGVFTLYTSDLSPVHFDYTHSPEDYSLVEDVPLANLAYNTGAYGPHVVYKSRDGTGYIFENFVSFCDKFDDTITSQQGTCKNNGISSQDRFKSDLWAEQPYAGTYLTQIKDDFGNYIDFYYNGFDENDGWGKETGNPFVHHIVDTYGRNITFRYSDSSGKPNVVGGYDINSRLISIEYPNPVYPDNPEKNLYRHYVYQSACYPKDNLNAVPLLKYSFVSTENFEDSVNLGSCEVVSGNYVPGTLTEYQYSPSQELTAVVLPTGQKISYEYDWRQEVPAYNALSIETPMVSNNPGLLQSTYFSGPSRVVSQKKINCAYPKTKGEYDAGPTGEFCQPWECENSGNDADLSSLGNTDPIRTAYCYWDYDYGSVWPGHGMSSFGYSDCNMGNENFGVGETGDSVAKVCSTSKIVDPFNTVTTEKFMPSFIQPVKRTHVETMRGEERLHYSEFWDTTGEVMGMAEGFTWGIVTRFFKILQSEEDNQEFIENCNAQANEFPFCKAEKII